MNKILHPLWTLSPILSTLLLSACSPPWEGGTRAAINRTSELTESAYQFVPSSATEVADKSNTIPKDIATLDQLVQWGLQRNPQIAMRLSQIKAQESTIAQVSSLPEPTLKVIPFGEMAETAAGEVGFSIGIEQKFPSPGLLGAKAKQEAAKTKSALALFEQGKVSIAFQIRNAWHTYLWALKSESIIQKQIALLEQLKAVITVRVEAQTASQSDAVRIGVVIDELKAKERSWVERKNNAKTALLVALNITTDTQLNDMTDVGIFADMNTQQLQEIAHRFRPDFIANHANIDLATAKGLLARSKRRPSFGTFFNYSAVNDSGLSPVANGDDQWQIGFSLSLPIWTSAYAAADAEAAYLHEKALYEEESITNNVLNDTNTAWESMTSSREQLKIVQIDLLNGAKRALELETASYESGNGSYQDLIQSWRRLFAAELQEAFLMRAHAIAIADVLRVLGVTSYTQVLTYLTEIKEKKAE